MQNNSSQNAINLIIAKLKSALDIKTDTQLAAKLGVRQNTLSTWKKRETIDYPLIISKCDSESIDLNWLFDPNNEELIAEKLLPELLPIDKNGKSQTGDDKEKLSGILSGELSGIDENTLNEESDNEKKYTPIYTPIGEIGERSNLLRDGDIADSGKVSNENSPARINGRGVEVRSTFDDMPRNYYGATRVESGGIPLIPIDAAAGILSGDNTQVMDYECEHYIIPAFHSADFLIRVLGDSMTPRYMSGDLVACMRLQVTEFMQWNRPYVIDSTQGVLLKRVKRSATPDHLLLVSENEEYDAFDIPMSEIQSLAMVVGLIRIE